MLAALSEGQRRDLERLFPGVPVAVTPYGVDAERFRPDPGARRELRRELGLADGEMVACFAARPDRQKGLDLVLEALARLRRSHPVGVRLLVAGREADWMRPLAGRLGVADAVLFLGHRDDIERCYQAADALVVASLSEVNPQVAHEAAASGLPVVSTPVHGADELVADGRAGMLVERSPEAIATALGRLAADPDLRERLGAEGRRRALELGPDAYSEATLALYERLLSEPRR
jgi:glycosyltransferase involved in cell wall biosynthesis